LNMLLLISRVFVIAAVVVGLMVVMISMITRWIEGRGV